MVADLQTILEKQSQRTDELEARWEAQINERKEALANRQETRRQREEEARQSKGFASIVEHIRDRLDPERIETRRREAARLDAQRGEREASERLALEAKIQQALEKNRQKLEAMQDKQRQDLDRRHEEEIARIIERRKKSGGGFLKNTTSKEGGPVAVTSRGTTANGRGAGTDDRPALPHRKAGPNLNTIAKRRRRTVPAAGYL